MARSAERRSLPAAALLTGHMDRVGLLRSLLDGPLDRHDLPGPSVVGRYAGIPVLVLGTGMGGPATVRAVAALASRGCRLGVRVGGAGPVHGSVRADDLVVATAAVRQEGASRGLLDGRAPAVADPHVVRALQVAAARTAARTWVGVVQTKDSFYGEVDPSASPVAERLSAKWTAWQRLGVLASEMEAAPLFAAGQRWGMRTGAILRVNDVAAEPGTVEQSQRELCIAALDGVAGVAAEGLLDE